MSELVKPVNEPQQTQPLGDGIGLFIGMYEGIKSTGVHKTMMLRHLNMLIAEVKRLQPIESALTEIANSTDPYYFGHTIHRNYARKILGMEDSE